MEGDGSQDHQHDLNKFDNTNKERLLIFIGYLTRSRREDEERKDKKPCDDRNKYLGIQPMLLGKPERYQDDKRVFEEVVVKRPEKLRKEERQKTPRRKKLKLSLDDKDLLRILAVCSGNFNIKRRTRETISD